MNRKYIFIFLLSLFSFSSMAGTQIVPPNRLSVFTGGILTSTDWTRATSSSIPNSIYILKSNGDISFKLTSNFSDVLGIAGSTRQFVLDSKNFLGIPHARISDKNNVYKGQCVDFVKFMLGNTSGTSSWYPGKKLSDIPSSMIADVIPTGTVIAYFNGKTKYSDASGDGHVLIVLGFTFDSATMKPTGITVLDQNFLLFNVSVQGFGTGQSGQSISRHFLKWNGSGASGAANYHILDIH
jgi:hypothetical protein